MPQAEDDSSKLEIDIVFQLIQILEHGVRRPVGVLSEFQVDIRLRSERSLFTSDQVGLPAKKALQAVQRDLSSTADME